MRLNVFWLRQKPFNPFFNLSPPLPQTLVAMMEYVFLALMGVAYTQQLVNLGLYHESL